MGQDLDRETRDVTFLLVDDDEINIRAITRTIKKLRILNRTICARDGIEAIDILLSEVEANDGRLPPIIVLLDLNMPRMGGIEFLETVRADSRLSKVVVIVFSSSDVPADIQSAYKQHVAGYIVKESPSESFTRALEMLGCYSRIIELPE
ncbi:response regulator [Sulfitobacter sp. LCG007]